MSCGNWQSQENTKSSFSAYVTIPHESQPNQYALDLNLQTKIQIKFAPHSQFLTSLAMNSGLGSLMFGFSENGKQNLKNREHYVLTNDDK